METPASVMRETVMQPTTDTRTTSVQVSMLFLDLKKNNNTQSQNRYAMFKDLRFWGIMYRV